MGHKLSRAKHLVFTDVLVSAKFPYRGTLHLACYVGEVQAGGFQNGGGKIERPPPSPTPTPAHEAGRQVGN